MGERYRLNLIRSISSLVDIFGDEYGWRVSDILDLTLEEIYLINDARTIRDNHLYRYEQSESKTSKSGKNFTKASGPSDGVPSGGKKGGSLSAEQALGAFQSGAWGKK